MQSWNTLLSDDGFTFVEMVVSMAIIAVLLTIALPSLLVHREQAWDLEAKLMLTTAARGEAALDPELGGYTDDPAVLAAAFPEYDFSGTTPESIHVVVGDVEDRDDAQVLLYTWSRTDRWFGLRLVRSGPDAGRHTCVGALARMTLPDCDGREW
jgi:prepilin-type N-terminal cleavage/methylation domain-containing protein